MPTVQNHQPNEIDQTTAYKTATHDSRLQTAPLDVVENDEQAAFASGKQARPVQGRYAVSSAGVASALKSYAFYIIAYLVVVALFLAGRARFHKPITPVVIGGEILHQFIMGCVVVHATNFKGRSKRAWQISWLFRLIMLFAYFSISDVMKGRDWTTADNIITNGAFACLAATVNIAWQYSRQTQTNKKRDGELP